MLEQIIKFFNLKLYTVKRLEQFVLKGVITREQFNDIVKNDP